MGCRPTAASSGSMTTCSRRGSATAWKSSTISSGRRPERGSLIDPRELKGDLFQHDYESVRSLFAAVLKHELITDEQAERAVTAQGMAHAAELWPEVSW